MDLSELMPYAVPAGAVLVGIIVVWFVLKAKGSKKPAAEAKTTSVLKVSGLDTDPPPAGGYQLLARGTPVRLAAVVGAPAGRGQAVDEDMLTILLEELIPGMGQFFSRDVPMIDAWPPQISTQGFVTQFFAQAAMPDRGKGSRWGGIAGRVTTEEGSFMVGVLLYAGKPTSLGEHIAEGEGEWGQILQVQKG